MSRLSDIKGFPTSYEKVHESIYRSYQILELVYEMIERGDSTQTIKTVIDHLREEQK